MSIQTKPLPSSSTDFCHEQPIIIYSMGKVGSTTVYNSLKGIDIKNPVYRVNFLSDEGIQNTEEFHLNLQPPVMPNHLKYSRALRQIMGKAPQTQWTVITLVREPISRDVSDFFYQIERFHPGLIDKNGHIREDQVIKALQVKFRFFDASSNYTCNWFDDEFKKMFPVDVYTHPFAHSKGFSIIHNQQVKLLIIRLEDLNRCLSDALAQFLDLPTPIQIVTSNVQNHGQHGAVYTSLRKRIRFSKSLCDQIYASKYATHFYSPKERFAFMRYWCGEA